MQAKIRKKTLTFALFAHSFAALSNVKIYMYSNTYRLIGGKRQVWDHAHCRKPTDHETISHFCRFT